MRFDALAAGAVYVGAVVGAGFASGREIMHFFTAYGTAGLAGCALAALLFAWAGAHVLGLAAEGVAPDYTRLYARALGSRLARPSALVVSICLYAGLATVLAGGGALAAASGLNAWLGAGAMALAIMTLLAPGRSGLLRGSLLLVPPIVAGVLALGVAEARRPGFWHRLLASAPSAAHVGPGAWALGACLYVGYNILLGAVALCAAGRGLPPRAARRGGLLGGLCLGATAAIVHAVLIQHLALAALSPLPLGAAAAQHGGAWIAAYGAGLALALLTTGLATAQPLAERLTPAGRPSGLVAAAIVLAALPVASLGLPWLVGTVYPAEGGLGILLCLGLLIARVRRQEG